MEASVQQIKEVFNKYDENGSGCLSRVELRKVMSQLGKFDEIELDQMLSEMDKDGNGEIDIHEFVEYVSAPTAQITLLADGDSAMFDLEKVLLPLFKVYDANNSDSISLDEFTECHDVLVGAMNALPPEDNVKMSVLAVGDAARIFETIDTTGDKKISIEEFVDWQRNLLENSGISRTHLLELVQKLSSLLQTVHMLNTTKKGRTNRPPDKAFEDLQQKMLDACKELWHTRKRSKIVSAPAHLMHGQGQEHIWTKFPEHLTTTALVTFNMRSSGLMTKDVIGMQVSVNICVPELETTSSGALAVKQWHAKAIRSVKFSRKSKKRPEDHLYYYKMVDGAWVESEESHFYAVFSALPQEFRVMALFITEANFGSKMAWAQILNALRFAVEYSLLEAEDIMQYSVGMEKVVIQAVLADGKDERVHNKDERKALAAELVEKVELSPLQVMASMCDIGVIAAHPLWARPNHK